MYNIDKIMDLLNETRSLADQELGIQLASKIKCIKVFFQPFGETFSKEVWENCAKVIVVHSDDELIPYLCDMFVWIQDLNWPGAELIYKRLADFCISDFLLDVASKFLIVANALEDDVWAEAILKLVRSLSFKE